MIAGGGLGRSTFAITVDLPKPFDDANPEELAHSGKQGFVNINVSTAEGCEVVFAAGRAVVARCFAMINLAPHNGSEGSSCK